MSLISLRLFFTPFRRTVEREREWKKEKADGKESGGRKKEGKEGGEEGRGREER